MIVDVVSALRELGFTISPGSSADTWLLKPPEGSESLRVSWRV